MAIQSKWIIENESKNRLVRASTIKPRMDYATEIVDSMLDILVQKKQELNRENLEHYRKVDGSKDSMNSLGNQIRCELEISYCVESLRQVRRSLDLVAGLGNIPTVLSPTISIVRTTRSRLLALLPVLDFQLGELSLI